MQCSLVHETTAARPPARPPALPLQLEGAVAAGEGKVKAQLEELEQLRVRQAQGTLGVRYCTAL